MRMIYFFVVFLVGVVTALGQELPDASVVRQAIPNLEQQTKARMILIAGYGREIDAAKSLGETKRPDALSAGLLPADRRLPKRLALSTPPPSTALREGVSLG